MSFKESVNADNKNVFLNMDEFAEKHTVRYDGNVYKDIPVLLTKQKQSKRTVVASDNMQGIHLVSTVAHIALSDIDNNIPEQKQNIEIDDGTALGKPFYKKYKIITSDCEMGMVRLELEAHDE